MYRTKTVVPILAATGLLALGGASAWGYSNGQADPGAPGQAQAFANCESHVDLKLDENFSPSGGPKEGFAPLNCNHFFGPGGQPPQ